MAGYTYQDLVQFAESSKTVKTNNNDRMLKNADIIDVSYRGNVIATYDTRRKEMIISSAGWQTKTTKDRLNKILPSGYITQHLGKWFFVGHNNLAVPFKDDMLADPNVQGKPIMELEKETEKEYRAEKRIHKLDAEHEQVESAQEEKSEHTTEFANITPEGEKVNVHNIDLSKVKSDDPLAYAFGLHQGMSGEKMEVAPRGESLAPEYVRGWKEGWKKRHAELMKFLSSKKAQMPMTMTHMSKLGSLGSGWHKEPVSHSYASKFGKAPAKVRGR